MNKEEFWLSATPPTDISIDARDRAAGWVLCPALAGWPAAHAECLAHLPLRDANGAAMAALAGLRTARGLHIALFAGDPFLHLRTAFRAAERAGVEALAAYPTAQSFDGETAHAIASAGYGLAADVAFVRAARAAGFATLAFAFDTPSARALLDAGATRIALHPGPTGGDPRADRAALADLETTRAALGDAPVLIHRAFGHDPAKLDALVARARGSVRLQPSMP
jgi:predicted TIM-barrel enzyme